MATGDIYELTLSGNLLGQTCQNVWVYRNEIADGTAGQLKNLFRDVIIPFITPVIVTRMTFTDIVVINKDDPSDHSVEAFSFPGLRSGDCEGPFDAWGFKKNPNRPDYKAGGTRFAGVEVGANQNGYPNGFYAPRLNSLAGVLSNNLITGAVLFHMYIESERCVKDADGHCTDAPKVHAFIRVSNTTFDTYTTQNSRKFGVGA